MTILKPRDLRYARESLSLSLTDEACIADVQGGFPVGGLVPSTNATLVIPYFPCNIYPAGMSTFADSTYASGISTTSYWEAVMPIGVPILDEHIKPDGAYTQTSAYFLLVRKRDYARYLIVGIERPASNPTIQIVRMKLVAEGGVGGSLLQENSLQLLYEDDTFITLEPVAVDPYI